MHSSRMRTARLLPVSPSMHYSGWGVPAGGCTWYRGGTWSQGCTWSWGVYLVRGCTWSRGGVPAWGVPAQVLPPVNRMTNRCKNITLPQTSFAGGNKNWTIFLCNSLTLSLLHAQVGVRVSGWTSISTVSFSVFSQLNQRFFGLLFVPCAWKINTK